MTYEKKKRLVSFASEDYLETIYQLANKGEHVRSVDVATALDVSKASVNKAMNILKEAKLIEQPHYGLITLTQVGQDYAKEVLRRHTMLKRFLHEVLGVDQNVAEQEACQMEHVISDETMAKWLQYLEKILL